MSAPPAPAPLAPSSPTPVQDCVFQAPDGETEWLGTSCAKCKVVKKHHPGVSLEKKVIGPYIVGSAFPSGGGFMGKGCNHNFLPNAVVSPSQDPQGRNFIQYASMSDLRKDYPTNQVLFFCAYCGKRDK
eukprot:g14152.t1